MTKANKDKQCYTKHIEERQTIPWPKPTRTNNVIQNITKTTPCWFWPWYCLTFFGSRLLIKKIPLLFSNLQLNNNIMAKTIKDKQCYAKHIDERQTISWPKQTRTSNVMQNTSKNVRQYNCQNQQGQTMLYKGALSAKPKPYNIK
jgi:hypothetical protein